MFISFLKRSYGRSLGFGQLQSASICSIRDNGYICIERIKHVCFSYTFGVKNMWRNNVTPFCSTTVRACARLLRIRCSWCRKNENEYLANSIHLLICLFKQVYYSRLKFLRPELQKAPHTGFDHEVMDFGIRLHFSTLINFR